MFDLSTALALAIPIGQGVGEWVAMRLTGTARRDRQSEWTFYAVNIPYWSMILLGLVERHLVRSQPSLPAIVIGVVLAVSGIALRVACHFQLAGGFSPYVEMGENHQLVTSGFYRFIRHPMYLGSLLIFVGLPLLLAAKLAWLMAVAATAAIVVRIVKEERLLSRELPGYREYTQRSWRLVPGIW